MPSILVLFHSSVCVINNLTTIGDVYQEGIILGLDFMMFIMATEGEGVILGIVL